MNGKVSLEVLKDEILLKLQGCSGSLPGILGLTQVLNSFNAKNEFQQVI